MKQILLILAVIAASCRSYAQTNTFPSSGNVGIGTTSPGTNKLAVFGDSGVNAGYFVGANSSGNSDGLFVQAGTNSSDVAMQVVNRSFGSPYFMVRGDGNVGIGTATPNGNLHVKGTFVTGGSNANLDPAIASINPSYLANSGQMLICWNRTAGGGETDFMSNQAGGAPGGFAFYSYPNNGTESQLMWIQGNGNVAIGTTDAKGYKLAVNGNAIATSMTVKLYANWPDYVFKPTYHLPSLNEVKAYIDKNQHLPDMPSEQEVAKNGINLGEIVKLQTKKIEELTLYLIEKDKQDKQKQVQINQLKRQVETLMKKRS